MKRYLLFAYELHEARGGWHDFVGSFDTIEEASEMFKTMPMINYCPDMWHIVDSQSWEIIKDMEC